MLAKPMQTSSVLNASVPTQKCHIKQEGKLNYCGRNCWWVTKRMKCDTTTDVLVYFNAIVLRDACIMKNLCISYGRLAADSSTGTVRSPTKLWKWCA